MSPTVLREKGYRVVVYFNDHNPPHVHVIKDRKDARVRLDTVEIIDNRGYSPKELKAILEIIEGNQEFLLEQWAEHSRANEDEEQSDDNPSS